METSRRDFIKRTCLSGFCLCGFSQLSGILASASPQSAATANSGNMSQSWIAGILTNLNEHLEEDDLRKIVKSASLAHYNQLGIENTLIEYKGRLDDFMQYIEKEWGWKFTYSEDKRVLLADENKPYCVCPLIDHTENKNYPALCFCSEGFAERMFSYVCGRQVRATVVSSVMRGNDRCIYRIELYPAFS